jgi:parallel beta-helix repeat protein
VEIVLNGFTVTTGSGLDYCIEALNSSTRLTVRNGTLADCRSGVYASTAAQVVVEDVTVKEPWGRGINLNNVGAIAVRRVTVLGATNGTGSDGIGIYSPSPFFQNAVVEDCTLTAVPGSGIVFNRGAVHIRNNRVTAAGDGGIWVFEARGSEISGNLVVGSANDTGITIVGTHGSTVSGNIVRDSYNHGIRLTTDSLNNLVRDNVSTGNGLSTSGHGLYVEGSSNKIEGNTLNFNGGAGLYFSTAGCRNTFGRNMAQENVGTGVGGCNALFPPESCSQCNGAPNVSFGDNLIPGPPVF